MFYDIDARVLKEAEFIVRYRATVRETGKVFGVSKSTVHYDMVKRLPTVDEELYLRVRELLAVNLSERHIRGGIATRKKYKKK
ncbi:MAG: sporulation transcriptional regulator SpoIIID [Candidatus Borkfalkiaceae bacterium]|nr:sporulation transcriptional regulator SpoIIID [Christensenellaceae bacterium]